MKNDRVELQRLLETVKSGDTIVATEVSRITRSTKQLCEIIELVKEKHIKLVLGTFVSELERNMISQRVKSGLKNAKAKGKQLGRPTTSTDDIPNVFYKHYPKYKNGEINKAEFARLCSLSYPTIFKYIAIVEG